MIKKQEADRQQRKETVDCTSSELAPTSDPEAPMATFERRVTKDGRIRWTARVFIGRDENGKRKFVVRGMLIGEAGAVRVECV